MLPRGRCADRCSYTAGSSTRLFVSSGTKKCNLRGFLGFWHSCNTVASLCGLFNGAVSTRGYIASNIRIVHEQWIGRDEAGSGWGLRSIRFRNLSGGTEKSYVNLRTTASGGKCFYSSEINYLIWLTHSMELNPSWEDSSCADTQEFPQHFMEPKVHCRVRKSPPLVPILSQISPFHTTPSYLSNIHFNIILSPTSGYSESSVPFWAFPLKLCMHFSCPHAYYIPCRSHPA
jgi:hypothetical protein